MEITDTSPFTVGDWFVEPELLRISKKKDVRKLEFKMMEILLLLAENQGEVISKQRLHDEVWEDVYVTDNALTRTVSKLRKVLGDDPHASEYIDTISKSGYRLVASVSFKEKNTDIFSIARINRKWVWGLVAATVIGVFTSMSITSADIYTGFHDPIPVSTLVGPEIAHDISPNGKKITFTHIQPGTNNPDVFVKQLDDLSQINFTKLESPQGYGVWSPDGNFIAYASAEDGTCGIYLEPSIGGEKKRVGDCYSRPEDFTWSPDGKSIVFTDYKSNESRRIYMLDLVTQEAKEILTPKFNMSHRDPSFTSDGNHLVFRKSIVGQGADIYKLNLSDRVVTQLTFDNARIFGLDVFDRDRQIVFSSNRGGQWALWRLPINGGHATRLYIKDRILLEPKISADDSRLIYKSVTDQTQLWEFNKRAQYKIPVPIVPSTRTDMHPSISPDGQKLVFISDRSGFFELWVHNFETNTTTKMSSFEGSFINSPSWSPHGSEIVFDARTDGDNGIYILDVASRMVRTFIDMDSDQLNACYSKDGKSIYYTSNHSGKWQVWKRSLAKDTSVQVTKGGGFRIQEGNDKYLYYSKPDTSGIWRLPKSGQGEEELFISNFATTEWGSWATSKDGLIYFDRTKFGVYHKSYSSESEPTLQFTPNKRIQLSTPTLTVTSNGNRIILAQIEKSEDELMMVEFE